MTRTELSGVAHRELVDHISMARLAVNSQNTSLARFSLLSANELRKLYTKEGLISSDESLGYKMIIVNTGQQIGVTFDVNPS